MASLGKIRINLLDKINKKARFWPQSFIAKSEDAYLRQIDAIFAEVKTLQDLRFIFVSGPTSSGKTTSSNILAHYLTENGHRSLRLSLDDYYKSKDISYDEAGLPDYESLTALDTKLLNQHLQALARGEAVQIPSFLFKTRERVYSEDKVLKLEEQDILIIEGLHALDQSLSQGLARSSYYNIFIMPYASLITSAGTIDSVDLRICRRIHRDSHYRGAEALTTIDYWPMIARSEASFVEKYLDRANFYLNSCLFYEYNVLAPLVSRLLQKGLAEYEAGTLKPSVNIKEGLFYADIEKTVQQARELYQRLSLIEALAPSFVPSSSLLQEFL